MKKIYLIDANSFIYRMFYGIPEFTTKSGIHVNAVFGIAKFFLIQLTRDNPDYIIFIKDAKGKNFRHEIDENYKATRDRMPDNLRSQIPIIQDMVSKMKVPIIEFSGYEADDIIGTLAKKYDGNLDYSVDILTGDKDLHSLVSDNVFIYDTMKSKKYSPKDTLEKFGVGPNMIIDYLAIVGDKSDNIPGIDGFGPKKAISLINNIGSLEKIYEILDGGNFDDLDNESKKIFKGKNLEKLENSRDNAFLSKKLATIDLNVEINCFNLEDYKFNPDLYLTDDVKSLFRELEFNSLLNEDSPKLNKWDDLGLKVNIIGDDLGIEDLLFSIEENYSKIVLDTETTSLDISKADLVGVSIYLDDNNIYYINRMHYGTSVSDEKLKDFLMKIFDFDILIIGHNIKYDLEIIENFLSKENSKYKSQNVGQISLSV